jgi:hypothetical protein
MQIVASEVGATIPGIDAEKQPQFLLELCQEYGVVSRLLSA